ncbi:kelch domain-containing protein 8A isoform X2 [Salmo trutta]|uniref:kelch domain-containing protein 8A isoform X2 n=1 Tax=Salmo trutta TaxID=8032 RepID=UPI000B4F40E1|nr:kelch domain-containing protein 8A-like isoform X2 [Salmo trutta]
MSVPSAHEFHWQSLARLPSGRVYHSLAEVGGQMYMLGGCDAAGRPSPALELYSPEGDRWLSLPPMPTPRAGTAVAVLGKQILVVGGVGDDQRPLKVVEVYNTEEGRWRKRSALREALMGVAIIVKDGRALAVGGMGADLLPRSILQQYDMRKDVWALLPPMPTPRYDATAHLLGNKIYVAGGRQCKRTLKVFEVYDSETRSWTTLPNMPCKRSWLKSEDTVAMKTKRADFASAFLRGRMVVAGGLGHQPSVLDTVEAFHPQKRKWERLVPMAMPRCSASSIVIRDRLLVVGGVNQVPSSAHEILYVKEEECL